MQIEVKGRNDSPSPTSCGSTSRSASRRSPSRCRSWPRWRSSSARSATRDPEDQVAEATLYLKGVTLRARDRARDMRHAINLCAEELARQVKRHRDKRRKPPRGGRRDRSGCPIPRPTAGDAAAAG